MTSLTLVGCETVMPDERPARRHGELAPVTALPEARS